MQSADNIFGINPNWQDLILSGNDDSLLASFKDLYSTATDQKNSIDKQIESNERLVQMMEEISARYQNGSLTYENALNNISTLINASKDGYDALENLSGMMDLDNIVSLENIASSADSSIKESAQLLSQFMTIIENNKKSVEGFETSWDSMSNTVQETVNAFNNAVSSMDSYLDAFVKNSIAINENTKSFEDLQKLILEQIKALEEAAKALEEAQKKTTSSNSGNRGSSSSSGSISSGGSTIWAGGEARSESKGSTAEIIGQYGTQEEKDRYEKYRQQQIDNNPNASNKAWKDAADKALQEELKNANVKKYHDGIKSGYVGGNTIKLSDMPDDKLWNYAYKIALDKLRTDEVFAILKKGEGVLTPNQMQNVITNSEMVGRAGASVINEVPVHKNLQNSYDCSIGEIHLHEVQNVDEFAKALDQSFASTMQQQMKKYNLQS